MRSTRRSSRRSRSSSDSTLNVEFIHRSADNPLIKAIEILSEPATDGLVATPGRLDFGGVPSGATRTRPITLANEGSTSVTLDATTLTGAAVGRFSDDFPDADDVTLAPGATTTIEATFSPDAIGARTATLTVSHDGAPDPLRIQLRGTGQDGTSVAFEKSALAGETSSFPTALQWGPDGRLYVADFAGDDPRLLRREGRAQRLSRLRDGDHRSHQHDPEP